MYFKYFSYAALLSTIFWIQILYLLLYSIYFNAFVKTKKPNRVLFLCIFSEFRV